MWVSQQELADILGIGMRQIRQLTRLHNMFLARENVSSSAKYDLAFCVHEYVKFKYDEAKNKNAATKTSLSLEKATHEQIKQEISKNALEMSNIKLAKLKRTAFEAADVEEAWAILLTEFKSGMINLSRRLAPLVISNNDINDITKIIDKEVNAMLEALASFDLDMIQSGEDAEDDQTAGGSIAAENIKPVKAKQKTTSKSVVRGRKASG